MNILLVTADQWRGKCLSSLNHPLVKTPNLDALAAQGVLFKQHFAQATPCAPSRTSLHTGMYMCNHRCVANGTPVSSRFTNWALLARQAGYNPSLFGYTDTALDPHGIDPDDIRLTHWSEPLPGIGDYTPILNNVSVPWVEYLQDKGYPIPKRWWDLYGNTVAGVSWRDGGDAPLPLAIKAADHETAFMVNRCIDWIGNQTAPWISHLSLLRPHPPFVAPYPYNLAYSPTDCLAPVRHSDIATAAGQHPFLNYMLRHAGFACSDDDKMLLEAQANYYGLMQELDDNLGRLFDYLKQSGQWQHTLIIFTSDHGEQLGDQWLWGKLGFYDASYHIPLIMHDPRRKADKTRGVQLDWFTENVDIMPSMLDWLGLPASAQCDGHSLLPLLYHPKPPPGWRQQVHWEYDFRDVVTQLAEKTLGLSSHQCVLSVIRDQQYKYVHFTALPPLLYDLQQDPGELCNLAPQQKYQQVMLRYASKLLSWRMNHTDRGITETMLTEQGPVHRASQLRALNSVNT